MSASAASASAFASASFETRKAATLASIGLEGIRSDLSPKGNLDAPIADLVGDINQCPDVYTTSSCSGRISIFRGHVKNKSSSSSSSTIFAEAAASKTVDNSSINNDEIKESSLSNENSSNINTISAKSRKNNLAKGGQWLLVEHDVVTAAQVHESLRAAGVKFMEEEEEEEAGGGEQESLFEMEEAVFRFEPFILAMEARDAQVAGRLAAAALAAGCRESGITALAKRWMVSVRCSIRLEVPIVDRQGRMLIPVRYLHHLVDIANSKMADNRKRIESFAASFQRMFGSGAAASEAQAAGSGEGSCSIGVVLVPKMATKLGKDFLKRRKWVDKTRRITPWRSRDEQVIEVEEEEAKGNCMAIPITAAGYAGLTNTQNGSQVLDELRKTIPSARVSKMEDMPAAGAGLARRGAGGSLKTSNGDSGGESAPVLVGASPFQRLKHAVRLVAQRAKLSNPSKLAAAAPRRYELLGRDLLLLPATAFCEPEWQTLENDGAALWDAVATAMGVRRVARQQPISTGLMRKSQVVLLWPQQASGGDDKESESNFSEEEAPGGVHGPTWVQHRENGIIFGFDVARVMFSSGNGSEKVRMGRIARRHETVLDLYAGIGYFTLPFLVLGKVRHLHACELNPDSVHALRFNMKVNGISEDRYTIHGPGDNRDPALRETLRCIADRVSLGLLPSSEDGWPVAVAALKSRGGVLHVHGNVPAGTGQEWAAQIATRIKQLAQEDGDPIKASWDVKSTYVSRVKSFAPRIDHLVADIVCRAPHGAEDAKEDAVNPDAAESVSWKRPAGKPVQILESVSAEQFWSEVFPAAEPVVLRGLDIGAAPKLWTPEYLRDHGPKKRQISVHVCPDGRMDFMKRNFMFKTMPFAEMIDRIQAKAASAPTNVLSSNSNSSNGGGGDGDDGGIDQCVIDARESSESKSESEASATISRDDYFVSPNECYYLRALGANPRKQVANFFTSFPELAKDFKVPAGISPPPDQLFSSIFRVSSWGLQLWTHYDVADNLLCHIRGRKRVVLFPPDQACNLYLPDTPDSSTSPILDIDTTDLSQYPLFRHAAAAALECILEPGDVLFLPNLWFHNVVALEPLSVSVNLFWRQDAAPKDFQLRDLYGNKDYVAGRDALVSAAQAASALQRLPVTSRWVRSFYRTRVLNILNQDD